MAYSTPVIVPSGTTFAQLKAGGFHGQLTRLANSNGYSPAVRGLILGPLDKIETGIVHLLDAFLRGEPISTADVNAKLLTFATALKAVTAALDEANVLVDTNPGTLAMVATTGATGNRKRRNFQ